MNFHLSLSSSNEKLAGHLWWESIKAASCVEISVSGLWKEVKLETTPPSAKSHCFGDGVETIDGYEEDVYIYIFIHMQLISRLQSIDTSKQRTSLAITPSFGSHVGLACIITHSRSSCKAAAFYWGRELRLIVWEAYGKLMGMWVPSLGVTNAFLERLKLTSKDHHDSSLVCQVLKTIESLFCASMNIF